MNLALSAALHNASEGAAVGSPFLPASFFNATSWSAGAGANGSVAAAPDVGDVPQVPAYIRTASTVACVIIMSIGVAGNAMVPAVILRSRDMRNSTNIFLVNLSVADLLVLLVCTPTVLVEVHSRPEVWLLGETMCKAVPFVELTVAHASVLTILAISFERYYAICEPLRAGYVCTKARALLICLLAWALAALLTSPVILVAEYGTEEYFDGSMVPVCFSMVDSFWPAFFFLATIAVFFLVPLIILVVLYGVIARHLMANPRIMSVHQQLHYRYRKQVVLMLGTVVAAFFVCLLPFRAFTLWIIAAPPETVVSIGYENHYGLLCLCRVMHYLNSAVNPILYNLMSSKFRAGFARLCGLGRRRRRRLALLRGGSGGARNGTLRTTTSSCTSRSSGRRPLRSSPDLLGWRSSSSSRTSLPPSLSRALTPRGSDASESSAVTSLCESSPPRRQRPANGSSPPRKSSAAESRADAFRRNAMMRSTLLTLDVADIDAIDEAPESCV